MSSGVSVSYSSSPFARLCSSSACLRRAYIRIYICIYIYNYMYIYNLLRPRHTLMSSGVRVSYSSRPLARLCSSSACSVRMRRALVSAVMTSFFTSASTASRPAAESFSSSSREW